MQLIVVWIINALALLVLPYIFDSIRVDGIYTALITALALGLINTLIRPILILFIDAAHQYSDAGHVYIRHQRSAVLVRRLFRARFFRHRILVSGMGRDRLQRDQLGAERAAPGPAR